MDQALLWTDGRYDADEDNSVIRLLDWVLRYFIQAADQLDCQWKLMKMGEEGVSHPLIIGRDYVIKSSKNLHSLSWLSRITMALCRQVPDLSKWIASLGSGLAGTDPSLIGAEQVIIMTIRNHIKQFLVFTDTTNILYSLKILSCHSGENGRQPCWMVGSHWQRWLRTKAHFQHWQNGQNAMNHIGRHHDGN